MAPISAGSALKDFAVQRTSRSSWVSLAGLSFQTRGICPALISAFSPPLLRCRDAATSAASMICQLISRMPARVSASWRVQIVSASGTTTARPSPRKLMNGSRFLIRYSVRPSDKEWLAWMTSLSTPA